MTMQFIWKSHGTDKLSFVRSCMLFNIYCQHANGLFWLPSIYFLICILAQKRCNNYQRVILVKMNEKKNVTVFLTCFVFFLYYCIRRHKNTRFSSYVGFTSRSTSRKFVVTSWRQMLLHYLLSKFPAAYFDNEIKTYLNTILATFCILHVFRILQKRNVDWLTSYFGIYPTH